jgi:hypothetical protein
MKQKKKRVKTFFFVEFTRPKGTEILWEMLNTRDEHQGDTSAFAENESPRLL